MVKTKNCRADSIVKDLDRLYSSPRPGGAEFVSNRPRRLLSEDTRGRGVDVNGADRARTGDLRLAKPALSQLSYSPVRIPLPGPFTPSRLKVVVGLSGVEPLTSRLSGVRSNQLSYRPCSAFVVLIKAGCVRVPTNQLKDLKKSGADLGLPILHSIERR